MNKKVYILSIEHRKKISIALTGIKRSKETRKKIGLSSIGRLHTEQWKINHSICMKGGNSSSFKKGAIPWNKGKKLPQHSGYNHPMYGKHHTEESNSKNSLAHTLEKHPQWKGGISKVKNYKRIKKLEYQGRKIKNGGFHTKNEWELLKKQYNFTCLCCKKQEPEIILVGDHIKPLILGGSDNIENIQPLCKHCNSIKHAKYIDYR